VQVGDFKVPIYATPSRKGGRVYPGFTAVFESRGKLKRPWRASREDLRRELRQIFGDGDEVNLRGPALREYERARSIANELGMEMDEALLQCKRQRTLAHEKGCTVEDALAYYSKHHDQSKYATPAPQVVEAFLADRKLMGNSAEDIATLRCRLHRFVGVFSCPLRDITTDQYRKYVAATGCSLRDRRNHREAISRLVNWAKNNDYLPADHPGVPRTGSRVRIPGKRVEVYDREQRELLIAQARLVELPLALVRTYVTIRSKECALVSWEDINWKTARLTVYADAAKKREPRSVSLVPELVARLAPHRKPEGRLYPFKSFYKVGPRLAKKAGIKWIRNGWRCSVISHLQAFVRDLGRVADEAGNSPGQIKKHYLKEVDPESGHKWFGLKPGQHHPLEPVRHVIVEGQQQVVPVDPALLPENVIPFVTVASQH
jgi:integrase